VSRRTLFIACGLILLVAVQALAVFWYLNNRESAMCEREGGYWNETFEGCTMILDASPTESA